MEQIHFFLMKKIEILYVSPLQMDVTCVSPLNDYNRKNKTFVVIGPLVVKWKKRQYATYSIIALIYKI